MDIGKEERVIIIEPLEEPVVEPEAERVKGPEPAKTD